MAIQLVGEINPDMFRYFDTALSDMERKGKAKCDITLNSEGGIAMDALAICARIRRSRLEYNMKFTITVYGFCASAATLILAYGDKRLMTEEAWCMVHEESRTELSGKVSEIEREGHNMRRQENQWNRLLEQHTKVSAGTWSEINKEDTYLTPEQCLEMGLIDGII